MLSQIAAKKKERVEEAKKRLPLTEIKHKLSSAGPLRPFREALLQTGMGLIAEVKKASPSKGSFALTESVDILAQQYEQGGAHAISVLTEEDFFCGSNDDLIIVRRAVTLPVLRKDFVLDPYQLYESRLLCADAVLLIAGFLSADQLIEYLEICQELGLSALVEAHNALEITLALQAGANIIGINNRNLNTFVTDVNHTVALAGRVPEDVVLVSESGIKTAVDVRKLSNAGANAILVGETLVLAKNSEEIIKELMGGPVA
jgi:indole-3-glycerol phosphate synthase